MPLRAKTGLMRCCKNSEPFRRRTTMKSITDRLSPTVWQKRFGRQDTLKLTRFVSAQPRYNLLFREVERELFPLVQEEGLAVIPFNPLAGGLLSGKYKHGDTPDKGRFSAELGRFGQAYHARYWHEREFETVAGVQEIARQHGTPITTLSVAWVLANPAITSVGIPSRGGSSTMARVYGLSRRANFVSKFWGQPSRDTIFCLARAFAWVNPNGTPRVERALRPIRTSEAAARLTRAEVRGATDEDSAAAGDSRSRGLFANLQRFGRRARVQAFSSASAAR
jgi:Aldo/keto reductase family